MRGGGAAITTAPAAAAASTPLLQIPLAPVADVRMVNGPSMTKSKNGLLRSSIQLRVHDRDEVRFVVEAQRVVADRSLPGLPPGMSLEWTGTFEHQVRANQTLRLIFSAVIALIALILYLRHKSWVGAETVARNPGGVSTSWPELGGGFRSHGRRGNAVLNALGPLIRIR